MSIEEMCRKLLRQAISDKIVKFRRKQFVETESVEELTAGDLCGMANLLAALIKEDMP